MNIAEILEQHNLKYEDLTEAEHKTLLLMLENLSKNKLTVEIVKNHIASMRDSVIQDLTKIGHESKQDIFLKARVRNYTLLLAFLSTPERAKKALENAISGVAVKK